jgi:HSP20 family protein
MALSDMIQKRKSTELGSRRPVEHPFDVLHREMDRLFDAFAGGHMEPFSLLEMRDAGFSPRINVTEDDESINISAELPGMDEKDIELTVGKDAVILTGEKKSEKENKGKGYYRMERSYGTFSRTIPLSSEVDEDRVEARFSRGVLNVKLPKTVEAQSAYKKVEIKGE